MPPQLKIFEMKQRQPYETIISLQLTIAMNKLMIVSSPLNKKLYTDENSDRHG